MVTSVQREIYLSYNIILTSNESWKEAANCVKTFVRVDKVLIGFFYHIFLKLLMPNITLMPDWNSVFC